MRSRVGPIEQGIAVSITGMAIVFAALTLISLSIALLPRVLALLEPLLGPEESPPASTGLDEALVAAISVALHRRRQEED